jgi:hypothetical protein
MHAYFMYVGAILQACVLCLQFQQQKKGHDTQWYKICKNKNGNKGTTEGVP